MKTGVPNGTLIGIEQGRHEPKAGVLIKIAKLWPEYAAYLLTEKIDVIQLNPEESYLKSPLESSSKNG